jgi:hypothetical protein
MSKILVMFLLSILERMDGNLQKFSSFHFVVTNVIRLESVYGYVI